MGTRADFYIGTGRDAEWIGSIAWDGYPDGPPAALLTCTSEAEFRATAARLIAAEDSGGTDPSQGWPWPWPDSGTTDYSYAFDGHTWVSCFGRVWLRPVGSRWISRAGRFASPDAEDGEVEFPDMSDVQAVARAGSQRSGVMLVGVPQ